MPTQIPRLLHIINAWMDTRVKWLNAQLRPKRPPASYICIWDSERHIKPRSTRSHGIAVPCSFSTTGYNAILSVLHDQGVIVISLHSDH